MAALAGLRLIEVGGTVSVSLGVESIALIGSTLKQLQTVAAELEASDA